MDYVRWFSFKLIGCFTQIHFYLTPTPLHVLHMTLLWLAPANLDVGLTVTVLWNTRLLQCMFYCNIFSGKYNLNIEPHLIKRKLEKRAGNATEIRVSILFYMIKTEHQNKTVIWPWYFIELSSLWLSCRMIKLGI